MQTNKDLLEDFLSKGKIRTLKALGFYDAIIKAIDKTQMDWYDEGINDVLKNKKYIT